MPLVVKSDQRREPFDEAKLRGPAWRRHWRSARLGARPSMPPSAHRPPAAQHWASARSNRAHVGELVMEELHHLDEVAYVRFASVYRSFQDVDAFRHEIEHMRTQAPPHAQHGPVVAAVRGVPARPPKPPKDKKS